MASVATAPTLTTARLALRALRPDDAADVFVFRSDPIVQRFNSEPHKDIAETVSFLVDLDEFHTAGTAMHWGITEKPEDRVLGMVSLNGIDRFHRRAGIGYDLARKEWGRGIGREAVSCVLEFGFGTLGLHRIDAETIADNHESVRLLKALGFALEATLREFSLEDDGIFHDATIWSLLDREFALQQRS